MVHVALFYGSFMFSLGCGRPCKNKYTNTACLYPKPTKSSLCDIYDSLNLFHVGGLIFFQCLGDFKATWYCSIFQCL